MAERRIVQQGKEALTKAGIYVAEFAGFRAKQVGLAELIANSAKYTDNTVETEGLYLGEGNKKMFSRYESSGLGAAWGATVYMDLFYVSESGRLYLSANNTDQSLRVYKLKMFGVHQNEAKAEVERASEEVQQLRMRGNIQRGFPGEYYLDTRLVSVKEKP